ncbi:MAG: polysaccharide biosynthesis/export family protein [Akkermansiaceae bacterium]
MKKINFLFCACFALVLSLGGTLNAQSISAKTTLNITIKGVPQTEQTRISGQYVVSPSGFVFLPLLKGGIRAGGLSSSALARNIEAAYRSAEMYQNPRITVISNKDQEAQKIDAQIVTVGGYVKRPGPVQFTRGMTLFQALSAAGGENAFGSIKRVELHRNGKRYVYDLRKPAHMREKVYPNDSINVPQKGPFGG